jgi:hypothetical protein
MTADVEAAIANLLRDGAPPERDPLFRVAVLECLERARFRRRRRVWLAVALTLAAVAAFGLMAGGGVRDAAGVLLVGAALAAGYFVLLPGVLQLLARG